jgi:hypothetical protein
MGGRQRDVKTMKAAVVNDQEDYQLLLGKMRQFLSGLPKNANFLQKLPVELRKDEDVKNQMSSYWLPSLERYFGTIERFVYYFWKTDDGKKAISALMATDDPAVEQLLRENIDAFATPRIKEWRDKVQAVYDSQSVEVLKGLFHSESSYQQQRELLLLEKSQSTQVGIRRTPTSSKLPRYLKTRDHAGIKRRRKETFLSNIFRNFNENHHPQKISKIHQKIQSSFLQLFSLLLLTYSPRPTRNSIRGTSNQYSILV